MSKTTRYEVRPGDGSRQIEADKQDCRNVVKMRSIEDRCCRVNSVKV